MVLNDIDIREAVAFNKLVELEGKPYSQFPECYEKSIQPASYDLTLGKSFKRMKEIDCIYPNKSYLDLDQPIEYVDVPYISSTHEGVVIRPGEFLLANTNEIINLPDNVSGFIHGRSSIGRAGLIVETAGFADPAFSGTITLEIVNLSPNPIRLVAGMRIAQIVFIKMTDNAEQPYKGKYQGQREATGSRIHMDFS